MLLVEILKEIFPDINEILDVFNFDGVLVKEQIETVAPPFLLSQQFHYFPQNEMLFLLIVADLDVSNFLHQPGCPESAKVVIPILDCEQTEPDEAAVELQVGRFYVLKLQKIGEAA